MGRTGIRSAWLALCLVPALLTGSAADADWQELGRPMPVRYTTSVGSLPLYAVSSELAMSPVVTPGEPEAGTRDILWLSDGSVAKTLTVPASSPVSGAPYRLAGHNAVWLRRDASGVRTVVSEDLVMQTSTTTVIPEGDKRLWSDSDWTLTARGSGPYTLHLLRPDGSDTVVPEALDAVPTVTDGDERDVVLRLGPADHALLDIREATMRPTVGERLTLHRVIGWSPSGTAGHYTVTWADRDTPAEARSFDVPLDGRSTFLREFGDRLVVQETVNDCRPGCRSTLRPVDLENGTVGEVLVEDVSSVVPTADGSLVLTLDDSPTGHLAVLADNGAALRRVAPLPAEPDRAAALAYNGPRVLAAWPDNRRLATVLQTTPDGSSAWDPVPDSSSVPMTLATNAPGALQAAGEVVMGNVSRNDDDDYTWRLSWPGGSRDLGDDIVGPELGHGGLLLARDYYVVEGSTSRRVIEVQDVRTGQVLLQPNRFPQLDGTWAWTVEPTGALTGVDTSGSEPTRLTRIGRRCGAPTLTDVRGRWALVRCEEGRLLVDLTGALLPWVMPYGGWQLGNDFAFIDNHPIDSTHPRPVMRVIDFSAAHNQREYAPSYWNLGSTSGLAVPDEAGSRSLAAVDAYGQVRVVDLDWVADPPTWRSDRTAPQVTRLGGSRSVLAAVPGGTEVAFRWTYEDPATEDEEPPTGVVSYDVRHRVNQVGRRPGAWQRPTGHQGITATSVTKAIGADHRICLEVRARDAAGNLSPWSAPRCTTADGTRPTVTKATAGQPGPLQDGSARVQFSYDGGDALGIHSFQVQYRTGPQGVLSRWRQPAAWRALTRTEVARTVRRGHQVCFRVRVRDRAGLISRWSSPACRTVQ